MAQRVKPAILIMKQIPERKRDTGHRVQARLCLPAKWPPTKGLPQEHMETLP